MEFEETLFWGKIEGKFSFLYIIKISY